MTRTEPSRLYSPDYRGRSGQPHPHAKHPIGAYWPYLPLFLVLGLGLLFNLYISRQHHTDQGFATNITARALLLETNAARTAHKQSALQVSKQLTAAAQAKADDMATRGYWSHITPDGQEPWSFIQKTGYPYEAAGENLAYGFGTSQQVVTAWMRSPEHRANVLSANYQDVGFATARAANLQGTGPQTITVALYGEPVGMINASTNSAVAIPVALAKNPDQISRLRLLTTQNWAAASVTALTGAALLVFALRHVYAWHKVLVRGERFFIKHPLFDVFLMAAVVFALLLSRMTGSVL